MNLTTIILLISSGVTYFIFSLAVFIISWRQILMKIKLMITKSKGNGLVAELTDNKGLKIHVTKITGKNLKLGKSRYYDIDPDHFLIADDYNAKGLVVSENIRKSINPKLQQFTALDSESLDNLIKRAVVDGQYSIFELIEKIKKTIPLALMIIGGYMVISLFLLYQIYSNSGGGKVL